MSNAMRHPSAKALKNGHCAFCAYVRGREGENPSRTYGAQGKNPLIHNNNNIYYIYINDVGESCVMIPGIACVPDRHLASFDSLMVSA